LNGIGEGDGIQLRATTEGVIFDCCQGGREQDGFRPAVGGASDDDRGQLGAIEERLFPKGHDIVRKGYACDFAVFECLIFYGNKVCGAVRDGQGQVAALVEGSFPDGFDTVRKGEVAFFRLRVGEEFRFVLVVQDPIHRGESGVVTRDFNGYKSNAADESGRSLDGFHRAGDDELCCRCCVR